MSQRDNILWPIDEAGPIDHRPTRRMPTREVPSLPRFPIDRIEGSVFDNATYRMRSVVAMLMEGPLIIIEAYRSERDHSDIYEFLLPNQKRCRVEMGDREMHCAVPGWKIDSPQWSMEMAERIEDAAIALAQRARR